MNNLNIYTLNINGLRSPYKINRLLHFISTNRIDILCIQETHIENYFFAKSIESKLGLKDRIIWSYGTNLSNGVAILFINKEINYPKFQTDFDGRFIYVDFELYSEKFRLLNLYAPTNENSRSNFFASIIPFLVTSNHLLILGDFNFVFDTNIDKIGGNLERSTTGSKIFSSIIKKYNLVDAFRIFFHINAL